MASLSQIQDAIISMRQNADAEADASTSECDDTGNGFDGQLGLRISSIFVIFIGSFLGAVLPVVLARGSKMKVNGAAFFVAKYFGSGVIIGTAFLHLLSPAFAALNSDCVPDGPLKEYDFAAFIALVTVLLMFTVELVASRFTLFGGHSHDTSAHQSLEASDRDTGASEEQPAAAAAASKPSHHAPNDVESNIREKGPGSSDIESTAAGSADGANGFRAPGIPNDVSYPPGGVDHLGHQREHADKDSYTAFAAQLMAIFILEFGIIFHSVFIGLTLAVTGDEFTVLYVVLVFHQTFEGLGLGSRLAMAEWPRSKHYTPYVLGLGYAFSTPIAIAIGLGLRYSLQPGSPQSLVINGVFDAISAGILIYTGLVELLAHEFMFNEHMRNAGLKTQLYALGCVTAGAGLMAVLAIWA